MCTATLDGCIYFMTYNAHRMLKLDPNNNETMSSVGDNLRSGWKYIGTLMGLTDVTN